MHVLSQQMIQKTRLTSCQMATTRVVPAFFLAFCLLLLVSCSATPSRYEQEAFIKPAITWPLPPEPPRIGYKRSIERPEDIQAKKGFFRKVAAFLLGETADRIIKPYGVTVDSAGRVIVADTALKRVHVFDIKGQRYFWFGDARKLRFVSPIGVAVDEKDNIYISDSELKKVFIVNKAGRFVSAIGEGLERPTGIAVNKKEGRLYVVDTWKHDIKVYNLKGEPLFVIGGRGKEEGRFNYPTDISIDKNGKIYVTDSMNFRIQILDKDGGVVSMFGRHGDGSGDMARPKGVGVDGEGHIYVADALFDVVQIFDEKGAHLLGFGGRGQGKGMLWMPAGVFIDEGNRIYVADSYNRRVQVFEYIGEDIEGEE